jgi:hypothetical protein
MTDYKLIAKVFVKLQGSDRQKAPEVYASTEISCLVFDPVVTRMHYQEL